jgi:hypothetical protein
MRHPLWMMLDDAGMRKEGQEVMMLGEWRTKSEA